MNLQETLAEKMQALPKGPYSDGLKAVQIHIDVAVRHYQRGQRDDGTAFTDAIYRCNQAFEGSLKEAYRVLAGKDPGKKTPAQIEQFLTEGKALRRKVLDQLQNYRREWRNPSTHEYTLDFDEDEALLAIVSVTAFAIVLCDQVASRVAFEIAEQTKTPLAGNSGSLLEEVAKQAAQFANTLDVNQDLGGYALEGAVAGHLAAAFSTATDVEVLQNDSVEDMGVDALVASQTEKIALEVKASRQVPTSTRLTVGYLRASVLKQREAITGSVLLLIQSGSHDHELFEFRQNFLVVAPSAMRQVILERTDKLGTL